MNVLKKLLFLILWLAMVSPAQADLVAYWSMDEAEGAATLVDIAGGDNHATVGASGVVTGQEGKFGNAILLDGSNINAVTAEDIGFPLGNSPATVSLWFQQASGADAGGQVLFSYGTRANSQFRGIYKNGTATIQFFHWDNDTNGNMTMSADVWHHVVCVFDPDNDARVIYIDGAETGRGGNTAGVDVISDELVRIGADPRGYHFSGLLDDVAVWDEALTADDVAVLWNNGEGNPVLSDRELASAPMPAADANDVSRDTSLSWTPGIYASTHNVYLGTVFDDVNDADITNPLDGVISEVLDTNMLDPGRLAFGQTYYWRVDEVNAPPSNTVFKGHVWSFEVEPYAIAVTDVSVTASDNTEDPNRTIDGSGLADGFHGTDIETMWKTAAEPEHPVWIQFAFDKPCKLSSMKVWNHNSNSEGLLGFGFKDVTIETSVDGTTWSALPDVQFAQAPGKSDYAGTLIDLGGTLARYVMLTGKNNWSTLGLQNLGLSEVRFMQIPTHVRELKPTSGSVISPVNAVLTWRPGRDAASHQVLLGTNPDALSVIDTVTENKLDISSHLSLEETYYWQVNEVNDAETPAVWAGPMLEFSTLDSLVIDDMESYKDKEGSWIWGTWADGYENPTENGSTVGHGDLPETTIVRSPGQSMPLFYDNTAAPTSKATRTFDQPDDITDWTQAGIQTLVLHIHGDSNNTGGQLYVEINGVKIPFTDDAGAITTTEWTQWDVDLSSVNTSLSKVNSLAIGVDGAGVTGVIYVDDIALYRLAPEGPSEEI